MWAPPQDELIQNSPAISPSSSWTPPQEEMVNPAQPEDIGTLKSVAVGLMSGIPGAETAIAGVKSAFGPNTYDIEHQQLEDLKDKAWEQQPVSNETGKVSGFHGTGLVALEELAASPLRSV